VEPVRPAAFGEAVASLAPVFAGTALNGFASGGLTVLVGVNLAHSGAPASVVGLVMSFHFVGLMLGCRLAPPIIAAIGHARAFAVFTSLATCFALALGISRSLPLWALLRLGTGWCMAGAFTVIESWVNERVGSAWRGRTFSLYIVLGSGAAGLAPLSLNLADPLGHELFIVLGMAFALAPLAMMVKLPRIPVGEGRAPLGLAALLAISPGGLLACFGHGLANSAVFQLAPVYFERLAFGYAELSLFLTAATLAGVAAQAPIGYVSDRVGRHWVLLAVSILAAGTAVPLALAKAPPLSLVYLAGIACAVFLQPFYGLGVALTNDRLAGRDFVSAAGGLILAWAAGAAAGPIAASLLIDVVGPAGLYLHVAAAAALLALVIVHRLIVRGPPPPAPSPPAAAAAV
jgi:MFS family permease